MGNIFNNSPPSPVKHILEQALLSEKPPIISKDDLDDIWEWIDMDQNNLLDDEEIVELITNYIKIQEGLLKKMPKAEQKRKRRDGLCPGLDLAKMIAKDQLLRNRVELTKLLEESPMEIISFVKSLFGLSVKQQLTHAVFTARGEQVLFNPLSIQKKTRQRQKSKLQGQGNAPLFGLDPYEFDDIAITKALEASHISYVNDKASQQLQVKKLRETLRKIGKIEHLGPACQELTFEEREHMRSKEYEAEMAQPIQKRLKNATTFKNGTIVQIYSTSQLTWVLGEIIGAQGDHAVNVRYKGTNKFVNPFDDSKCRIIEKIVSTPYGFGVMRRLRHKDYFCQVSLDFGSAWIHASQVHVLQVQNMLAFAAQSRAEHVSKGTLLVKVVKCLELPKLDVAGLCDPYVEITIPYLDGTKSTLSTSVVKRNLNPDFNEVLEFPEFEISQRLKGFLRVYDKDPESKQDELVGSAFFPLPSRHTSIEDSYIDLVLLNELHRGYIVLQTNLVRSGLPTSEIMRSKRHFSKKYGKRVIRKKK